MFEEEEGNVIFHYVSAWEKQSQCFTDDSNLKGQFHEICEFSLNIDYFAHETLELEFFEEFVQGLFTLLTDPDYNESGNLTQFWKCVNAVAQQIVDIYPDWFELLQETLQQFDVQRCIPFTKAKNIQNNSNLTGI